MIYYVASTGQIIGGTAATSESDLAGITHMPSGSDYIVFVDDTTVASVNSANAPGTYSIVNLTPSTIYTFPSATGTLTFTEQSAADQLANAKSTKIAQLRMGYAQTMASGFQFSIGSTAYTFGWSTDDKTNLLATQESVTDGFITFPINYADIHGSPVSIPDQTTLTALKSKASSFFSAQHQQILSLISNAQSVTTVDAVNAIQWSPATY